MLFLIVAVLLFLLQNLSFKEFSRRFPNTLAETARMSRIALPLGALCLIPAGGAALLSPVGFAVSAAFSVCYVLTNALYLASLACGPFSLSAMLSSMGLLVTVVMNLLLWHESLTALRVAGVLCMVVVIVMTGLGRREGALSLRWFLLSLGAMVTNGLCGVTQKAYQMLDASPNPSAFNFWSFLFAGAIYLAISLARRAQPLPAASKKPYALCTLSVGVTTVAANLFMLRSLGYIPSVVAYPVMQGSLVALIALCSLILYSEKLTPKTLVSLLMSIAGIVLLNL